MTENYNQNIIAVSAYYIHLITYVEHNNNIMTSNPHLAGRPQSIPLYLLLGQHLVGHRPSLDGVGEGLSVRGVQRQVRHVLIHASEALYELIGRDHFILAIDRERM